MAVICGVAFATAGTATSRISNAATGRGLVAQLLVKNLFVDGGRTDLAVGGVLVRDGLVGRALRVAVRACNQTNTKVNFIPYTTPSVLKRLPNEIYKGVTWYINR